MTEKPIVEFIPWAADTNGKPLDPNKNYTMRRGVNVVRVTDGDDAFFYWYTHPLIATELTFEEVT